MLSVKESRIMWAWVCPVTGMVLDEGWGATENYAESKSTRYMGKRRIEAGEFLAVKVTIEPLSEADTDSHRADYAAFRARKDREEADRVARISAPVADISLKDHP